MSMFRDFIQEVAEMDYMNQDPLPIDSVSSINYNQPEVIKRCKARGKYSPDFGTIRYHPLSLVFMYDRDLKQKGLEHKVIFRNDKSRYLGEAFSATATYSLKESFDTKYCLAFKANEMTMKNKAHLIGEIYAVPPEVMLDLDAYHQNGNHYLREFRNVFMMDQPLPVNGKLKYMTQRCWFYLGVEETWKNCQLRQRPICKNVHCDRFTFLA